MYNLILYGISTWTIQYQLILQSKVESSSGQTECFSLPIHSDSCNMGLRLCDSSIIAEILRLTAAEPLLECATAFKSAISLSGSVHLALWIPRYKQPADLRGGALERVLCHLTGHPPGHLGAGCVLNVCPTGACQSVSLVDYRLVW